MFLISHSKLLLSLWCEVVEPECEKSSATTYFWYRQTLNTTSTIAESGGLNVKMTLSLLVAWIIVCLAVIRGIASSGKVLQGKEFNKEKERKKNVPNTRLL